MARLKNEVRMSKTLYGFQCPKCFISSGTVSTNTMEAPSCCGGVTMDAYEIPVKILRESE